MNLENPFPAGDPDRRAIWEMLVERDIEAFVKRSWSTVEGDFVAEGFFGLDAGGRDRPDAWRLTFPSLASYRSAWLEQAEQMALAADPEAIRAGLANATVLRDIEISGDAALAHKKFDGTIGLKGGGSRSLRWQTLYYCRKVGAEWKIAGFVGYLPNPMGGPMEDTAEPAAGARSRQGKQVPMGASQHRTAGPYSPVLQVAADELVVISGQAALAHDGSVVGADVVEQARVTLENCRLLLAAAGCGLSDVFKTNVYLTDLNDWQAFNEVYAALMPEPKPVRTAVQAALLPGLLVEVEMWAAKPR
ncbi:MAG: RidA family protein [Trueperaceae bacterium]